MLSVIMQENGGKQCVLNVMDSGRKSVVTEPLKQASHNGIQYKTKAAL